MRILYSFLSVLLSVLLFTEVSVAQTTTTGNIETTITDIVATIPGQNTNSFVIPTSAQMSVFASVFSQMNAKNYTNIQSLLTPYGYTITKFINTPTKDTLYLIKETLPLQYGWGTFIFNPNTTNDLAVEIPHPLWDKYTWSMGIKVFLGARAKWYFLAGTHRYANTDSSSDMAHVTLSMFYTGHVTNANAIAVQCHGFDGSSSSYSGYPDAVISCGNYYPSTIYYTLRDNYTAQGFNVGVFSFSTYSSYSLLGATTNSEGKWSNSNGKKFVHIEHDQPLRFDTTNLRKCANAIIATFGITTGIKDQSLKTVSYNTISAYPNPFNPSSSITVTLATPGDMVVSVKDILGRTVQELFSGFMSSGTHTFKLNAGSMPSGVYFCTLTGQNIIKSTKLILLK